MLNWGPTYKKPLIKKVSLPSTSISLLLAAFFWLYFSIYSMFIMFV